MDSHPYGPEPYASANFAILARVKFMLVHINTKFRKNQVDYL